MTKHEKVLSAIRLLTYTETEKMKLKMQEERYDSYAAKLDETVKSLSVEEKKLYFEILEKLGLKAVEVKVPDAAT